MYNSLNQEISIKESDLQIAFENLEKAQKNFSESEQSKNQAERILKEREARLEEINSELETTTNELASIETEFQIRIEQNTQEIAQVEEKFAAAQENLRITNREADIAVQEAIIAQAELQSVINERNNLQKSLDDLKEELIETIVFLNEIDSEISQFHSGDASDSSYAIAEIDIRRWVSNQETLQNIATRLNLNLERVSTLLSSLQFNVSIEASSEGRLNLTNVSSKDERQSISYIQVREGDELRITIRNDEQFTLYTMAFVIDSSGEINLIFPFVNDWFQDQSPLRIPAGGVLQISSLRSVGPSGRAKIIIMATNLSISEASLRHLISYFENANNLDNLGVEESSKLIEGIITSLTSDINSDSRFDAIEITAEIIAEASDGRR